MVNYPEVVAKRARWVARNAICRKWHLELSSKPGATFLPPTKLGATSLKRIHGKQVSSASGN